MFSKNRGMLLESIINRTLHYYENNNLAFIEKQIVPIKFKGVDNESNLQSAHIYRKSTVDYIGCFRGKFVAFEAKTTESNVIEKANFKKHQINYLQKIHNVNGVVFYLLFFGCANEFYFLDFADFLKFEGKAIHYNEIKKTGFKLDLLFPGIIDFLPIIENKYFRN
ncbi:Holliday junction resolvase RecU [Mycoplasmopsis columbinasalis]|uniref:Holliday junction resolvase RecU n=1 Tax=Mycoplasmopsis columbinasalis TaxID=114880 RepID=A0A449BAQ7_9BACT|nr:Holliday junction resolvase RecU [Mycoplasmopsis columbinasalis]VEU78279.1 penicillin-binding protein-related factor A recombinase [Mycoplasmopsis columbinasalis]